MFSIDNRLPQIDGLSSRCHIMDPQDLHTLRQCRQTHS
jgi:hypothetical protein